MFRACISSVRLTTFAVALLALAAAPIPASAGGHGGGGGYGGGYHGSYYHGGYDHYHGGFYGIGIGIYPRWGYGYGYGYPGYYPGGVIVVDPGSYGVPVPPPYSVPQPYSVPRPSPAPQPDRLPPPTPVPTTAAVEVHVPADAQVWFDDTLTSQGGEVRLFETPALEGDRISHYTVRAKWTVNGKEFDLTRKIEVQAGRRTVVDFLKSEVKLLPVPEAQ
jgi:uncharacterized protein (TIGR03000 family)